jgi:hypothetical protein
VDLAERARPALAETWRWPETRGRDLRTVVAA